MVKPDYAKWMLEDPRVNLAISQRGRLAGIDRPALATISLLTFMGIWNAYLVPLVYLSPLPDYQTLTIALIQYSKQFQTLYHIMAAGAVIILIPIIIVFIFLQRYFIRGLTEGATKG